MSILQIFTLGLSVLAMGVSYYAATWTYRSRLRPFLIFYNSEFDPDEETSRTLENAGSGPAIKCQTAPKRATLIERRSFHRQFHLPNLRAWAVYARAKAATCCS